MKIAIRADGGSHIGMGHIMRTLVLAKELRKHHKVFYVCRKSIKEQDKYQSGAEMVINNNFDVEYINENTVFDDIKLIDADCLLTDSYDVDEKYFNYTKDLFKYTGYIDDMNLYNHNVDFLINQNIGAENLKYKVNKETKLMLGTKYTMLRSEFRNQIIDSTLIREKIDDIMVTTGGSDESHLSFKLIKWLKDLSYNYHVVIGPSFDDTLVEKLKEISCQNQNVKLHFNVDICDLMSKVDLAISACGSTIYELCAVGVPIIGIILAQNQLALASEMENRKIIKCLGWYNEFTKEQLVDKLVELDNTINKRKNMTESGKKLIDGKGVYRIVNVINQLNV